MAPDRSFSELRLVLGDQLNPRHSWFDSPEPEVLYTLMEVRSESEYVTHHIQKIVGIFHAMRAFAYELAARGFTVHYLTINDPENRHTFLGNLRRLVEEYGVGRVRIQEPDEWRLDRELREALSALGIPFTVDSTEHFYAERDELRRHFAGGKPYRMEPFYRAMRRKHAVLMEADGSPASGRWNYDRENRKRLPRGHEPPPALSFDHDVRHVLRDIEAAGLRHIGEIDGLHFIWPMDREESLQLLQYFLDHLLPDFGRFQDALSDEHWSLYHSRLSFALNLKMLSPVEVIGAVESRWREDPRSVTLAQAEGFIRQVLGWREYMRGIYWAEMPEYRQLNFLGHDARLPQWFWSADTRMRCVRQAVSQSLELAYAHHIQRLMVTGNFCLLAGIHPDEVDRWYLGIYIDAFEWVEITNTRGMSQYADGGLVGSKPYVSSAAYIRRMGDHCGHCAYDPRQGTGPGACPFNSLYWHFLDRHRARLEGNARMRMMYRVWDRLPSDQQQGLLAQAEAYLGDLSSL